MGELSHIQRLQIENISRASADQRMGRCGRERDGICIRLYDEADYETRPLFTDPEILRTNMASVILQMETLKLGHIEDFPFVDRPAPRMINDAYQLLFELGALDERRAVTDTGRRLARWPLDVRLARIVEEGAAEGCLEDTMVLAAALSIQDPRERPLDAQAAADEAHARFADPRSDFVTLLKLWRYLRDLRRSISGNQFRKRCRAEFLNWQRVLEWFDLYQQLRDQAQAGNRFPGHFLPACPAVQSSRLDIALHLRADGVAQALGVLLGPAEALAQKQPAPTQRDAVGPQPIGREPTHIALVAQRPPGLASTDPTEQGENRRCRIGHPRGHHQGPGSQHRDQAGHDHLLDRRGGGDVHAAPEVGGAGALHQAGDLAELAPDLGNHTGSRTTHRPPHYHELGRRAVVKAVWDVDRMLAEASDQFDFLLGF